MFTTRSVIFLWSFVLGWTALAGQVSNAGQFIIAPGSQVVVTGLDVLNQNGGIMTNQGILATTTNITNQAGATLTGNGTWQLGGNWTNAGVFTAGTSTVLFNGSGPSLVDAGAAAFHHLHLDKADENLSLASPVIANGDINFLSGNNKIICLGFDFTAGSAATILGAASTAFFVTNGTGMLEREGLANSPFTFPVGADTDHYTPLTITENGDSDDIGVRCLAQPLANGSSGSPLAADAVDVSWEITEMTSGGSDLSVSAQWTSADELGGFVRADCGIALFNTGSDWDLPPAEMAAATGSDPYTRSRNNLTPGILAVLDEAYMNRVLLAPRIVLQGAFLTASMNMNDKLRSVPDFPLTAPTAYGTGKFVHSGWQPLDGYAINSSILSVTGDDAIVDWVFLWLKDPNNPATNIQSRVALLQRDGDVVDLDGVSPVLFPANSGNYIIAAGHRNHLSVRSPDGPGIALDESTATVYDFSTSMAQAYGTNPMVEVQSTPTSIFALWGGNTSMNNSVRATGPPSINDYTVILSTLGFPANILLNAYSDADVNMDGNVRVTGPPSINDYSKLLNILGIPTTIITEQQ